MWRSANATRLTTVPATSAAQKAWSRRSALTGRSIPDMSTAGASGSRADGFAPRAKVVHVTTTDMSLRYLVFAQLRAIRDAGGEAIGISAPGPWVGDLEREGIRHIPLLSSTRAMNPRADLRAAKELWHVLHKERPDVLHVHNPKPGLYGRVSVVSVLRNSRY